MAKHGTPRSEKTAKRPTGASISGDVDDKILEALDEIDQGLREFLNSHVGETEPLTADFSDGLLVSVLKAIAPNGKYPMEEGRFWQILDRYNPFSALRLEQTNRARLANDVESLFAAAENETFEDGFDSALSLELEHLVLKHGEVTLEIVSDLIVRGRVAADVAAHALRCLGEMRNEATREARRQLLERSLASPSHVIRDGAVVGLSSLRDPRTVPVLEAAAAREDYRLLRTNMFDLLGDLKGLQT